MEYINLRGARGCLPGIEAQRLIAVELGGDFETVGSDRGSKFEVGIDIMRSDRISFPFSLTAISGEKCEFRSFVPFLLV